MDTDRLDELFDRHLDGSLAGGEEAELESILGDPEARRRWRELTALEGKLLEEHMSAPKEESPVRGRKSTRRIPYVRFGLSRKAGAPIAWIAAGTLLALTALLLAVGHRTPRRAPQESKVLPVEARTAEPGPVEEIPRPREAPALPSRASDPLPPTPRPEPPSVPAPLEVPQPLEPVRAAPPEPPAPPKPPPGPTLTSIAVLERVSGEVYVVLAAAGRQRAVAGQPLAAGVGIETLGRSSSAAVVFPDGTRLELGGDTRLSEIEERPKRAGLDRGVVAADVRPQPVGFPMSLRTPNAEARVVGTRFTLTAAADETLLEVREGRVRIARSEDGASVEVGPDHYAVVARGLLLAARPVTSKPMVVSFTLINAETDQPVAGFDPLREGAVLNLSKLPTRNLNIRANVLPRKVGSVRFSLDGVENYRVERGVSGAIYSLAGDMDGRFNAWTPAPGAHTVTATPYAEPDGKGTAGTPLTLSFRVLAK
jgi:ferric-dicitrate binding protein FerR (iron transport regulator)